MAKNNARRGAREQTASAEESRPESGKIEASRKAFPSGLIQPEGALRFGADALLLASYGAAVMQTPESKGPLAKFRSALVVDLGCGCGASLFALALDGRRITGIGIDYEPQLIDAASANAVNLGLEKKITFRVMDLCASEAADELSDLKGKCDLVMANPPWLLKGRSNPSPSRLRENALSGDPELIDVFCERGAALLSRHGVFCIIITPKRMCDVCSAFKKSGMGLISMMPITSYNNFPATKIIMTGQKDMPCAGLIMPPLHLHEEPGSASVTWSETALAFCHWLEKEKEEDGEEWPE